MNLVIKIPKEFEEEFNRDKFEDSLSRVASDIESFGFQLSGRYERETIKMLREAFKEGTPLPKGHGDLIDRKDLIENGISKGFCDWYDEIKMADTIIEADKGSE